MLNNGINRYYYVDLILCYTLYSMFYICPYWKTANKERKNVIRNFSHKLDKSLKNEKLQKIK